tara:strand:- start:2146 stop:3420 length:1275 start_codon:yes stop_codon:yes gene_type:complete
MYYHWYKFLTYLFYPIAPIYLFFRKLNNKEHPKRYKEKMSSIKTERENGFLIWFHVASVGEAMSILPLIEYFDKEKNINKILITTITLSSANVLVKRFSSNKKIVHQFLPLDIPNFVEKFLRHWSPNISIFIDSEIWPNLIIKIKEKNIPLLLLNARITEKSFKRWNLIKSFARKIFSKIDLCIVANKESENYLKILGATNIKSYGNLKFARSKSETSKKLSMDFLAKIKNRKIWCAASTHPSEEIFCAKAHKIIKEKYKNILTVIIPRHINRSEKIIQELKKENLKVVLHDKIDQINDDTDILLVNAYGETLKFYQTANCVFLGKSLIESLKNDSGQNPIEAARLGCKIFHGPYTSNFDEIYKFLNSLKISYKANSPEILGKLISEELLKEKQEDRIIIKKIESYGDKTLNGILNEIKIYINN